MALRLNFLATDLFPPEVPASLVRLMKRLIYILTVMLAAIVLLGLSTEAKAVPSAPSGSASPRARSAHSAGGVSDEGSADMPASSSLRHNVIYRGDVVARSSWARKSIVHFITPSTHCSGTIVSPRSIVTAAHCVQSREKSIELQRYVRNEGVLVYNEGEFVISRRPFDNRGSARTRDDLAVITFRWPLVSDHEINKGYVTIPFASAALIDRLGEGQEVRLVGGGTVGFNKSSDDLRATRGSIRKRESSTVWVAGADGSGICGGDSGGPLIVESSGKQYVAGVLAEYWFEIDDRQDDLCTPGGGYNLLTPEQVGWIKAQIQSAERTLGE